MLVELGLKLTQLRRLSETTHCSPFRYELIGIVNNTVLDNDFIATVCVPALDVKEVQRLVEGLELVIHICVLWSDISDASCGQIHVRIDNVAACVNEVEPIGRLNHVDVLDKHVLRFVYCERNGPDDGGVGEANGSKS